MHTLETEPSLDATVAVNATLRELTVAENEPGHVVVAGQLVSMSSAPAVVGEKEPFVPSTKATWHSLETAAARVLAEDIFALVA